MPWREQWLSMSDDGEFRLWSEDGDLVYRFLYNGGSVQAALVDTEHGLVLAAMADMRVRVFDLDDPVPKGRCGRLAHSRFIGCSAIVTVHAALRQHRIVFALSSGCYR